MEGPFTIEPQAASRPIALAEGWSALGAPPKCLPPKHYIYRRGPSISALAEGMDMEG